MNNACCELCGLVLRLVKFYDPVSECSLVLCEKHFAWFANGRRKGGLYVPNARRIDHETVTQKSIATL